LALCRALEIPPDDPDAAEHRRALTQLNDEVLQKHLPTQADLARHPSMHRTDTLDRLTCVRARSTSSPTPTRCLCSPVTR
jgi:hypothetical protein